MIERLKGKLWGWKSIFRFDNWVFLLCSRVFFPKQTLLEHRIGGIKALIDYAAGEQNGTRACLAQRSYEMFVNGMSLPTRPSVLDLGANGGGFPLLMELMGISPGKCVAVELNPRTYARLQLNLRENLNGEVMALNRGVCERDGSIELSLGRGSISDSLFDAEARGSGARKETVPLSALSTLIAECFGTEDEIDLCKVDIEGAEFPIFNSVEFNAFRRCRNVIIEIHQDPVWTFEKVHEAFSRIGFELLAVRSPFEANVFGYRKKSPQEQVS